MIHIHIHTIHIHVHFFQLRGRSHSAVTEHFCFRTNTAASPDEHLGFFVLILTGSPSFTFHLIAAALRVFVHVMSPLIAFVFLSAPPVPSSLSFPSPYCYYSTLGFEQFLSEWKCKILSMSISLLTLEPLNCGN